MSSLGSTITPNSLAMIDVVAEAETPMVSMSASSRIVEPVDAKRRWVFKTPQNDQQMALVIVADMLKRGVKTVGFIGFADAYGEAGGTSSTRSPRRADSRSSRASATTAPIRQSTGQALKLMAAKPDAILIAGSGTPAALPQKTLKERGYAGKIYQTHGVANNDFLRVCGKDCEGTLLPAGPVLVAAQLPNENPVEEVRDRLHRCIRKGERQRQRLDLWRACLDTACCCRRPFRGLKTAQPGTKGVPRRVAQCARRREERLRCPRHLQHEPKRSPRPRPARCGHGDDPEREVGAAAVAKEIYASAAPMHVHFFR